MNFKSDILEYCSSIGLDTVGFCKCRIFEELRDFLVLRSDRGWKNEFEEDDVEKRINPFLQMEEGKTIISIAFPYVFDRDKNEPIYFSKYTWGMDYHLVVSTYLRKISEFIKTLGGEAKYFVDSNPLPERYIANQCGVGFLGKNNMLITEKYGSFVFLGEIITDLEINPDKPLEQKCGDCVLCHQSCPTKAINRTGSYPNLCLSYITQKKHIEDAWFEKLDGRLFGCDSCQIGCPYNKEAKLSNILEFIPNEFMKTISLDELIYIDNKTFKEKYSSTSCGWRGKNILQRNALINMAIQNRDLKMNVKAINSPYVKDYYHRLLKALHL